MDGWRAIACKVKPTLLALPEYMAIPVEGDRSLSGGERDEAVPPAREGRPFAALRVTMRPGAPLTRNRIRSCCWLPRGWKSGDGRVLAQLGSAETLPTFTGWRQCGQVVADSRDQRWARACSRRFIS